MSNIIKIRRAEIDVSTHRGPTPRVFLEIDLKPETMGVSVDLGLIMDQLRYSTPTYAPGYMRAAQEDAYRAGVDDAVRRLVRHFEDSLRDALKEHALKYKPVTIYDAFKG